MGEVNRSFTVLNVGCGRVKALPPWAGIDELEFDDGSKIPLDQIQVLHLDERQTVGPDIVCQLGRDAIALPDDSVDVAFALHVIEHIGRQGDLDDWFQFWTEMYRVLKPGARVYFESPYHTSIWCWADPTHTRAISEYTFLYLAQSSYTVGGAIPDYRPNFDFVLEGWTLMPDTANADIRAKEQTSFIRGVIRAVKPLTPYWTNSA